MDVLQGKRAVVTGPQGNLGPVWIDTLCDMGADVFAFGKPEFDVSSIDSMLQAQKSALAVLGGPPHIVINNAGIDHPPGPGEKGSFHRDLWRILDTNVAGASNVVQMFLEDMIAQAEGTIINIGSMMGRIGADWRNYPEGFEKPVAYNMSKAALEQYSRSLTTQYGRFGIRAATIAFAAYDSGSLDPKFLKKYLPNVPLGRAVSRQSAEAALRFVLTCPEFAGQTVLVDGGYTAW